MQLVRYDPLRDLKAAERDLDKIWGNSWGLLPTLPDPSAMDLYEEGGTLVAEVSLPNFKKEEIKVTTDGDVLEISAEHLEKEEDQSKRRYYFRESNNRYLRRVTLPEGTKTDKIEAALKDGVLKVSMPTSTPKKTKAKTVDIK